MRNLNFWSKIFILNFWRSQCWGFWGPAENGGDEKNKINVVPSIFMKFWSKKTWISLIGWHHKTCTLHWTSLLILPIQLLYFFSQLLYFFISLHFFVQILVRGWVTTYSQQQCNGLALVADFLSWVESSMTWVVECQFWVPSRLEAHVGL